MLQINIELEVLQETLIALRDRRETLLREISQGSNIVIRQIARNQLDRVNAAGAVLADAANETF